MDKHTPSALALEIAETLENECVPASGFWPCADTAAEYIDSALAPLLAENRAMEDALRACCLGFVNQSTLRGPLTNVAELGWEQARAALKEGGPR